MKHLKSIILIISATAIFYFVFQTFSHTVENLSYKEITAALDATSLLQILLSVVATTLSYLILTGYDFSSLKYVQSKVEAPWVMLTSFIAYAISNNVGFAVLSGGAIRMRLYTAAGLKASTITKLVAFSTSSFILGMLVFSAVGLYFGATAVADNLGLSALSLQIISIIILLTIALFVFCCFLQPNIMLSARLHIRLPTGNLAIKQIVISASDLFASAFALWILLPYNSVELGPFLMFYALAMTLSLLSNIPGGLGVFESMMMLMATQYNLAPNTFLASLLLYRVIYFLFPLVVATNLLAIVELRQVSRSGIAHEAWSFFPKINIGLALAVSVMLVFAGFETEGTTVVLSVAQEMIPAGRSGELQHLLLIPAAFVFYFTRGMFYHLQRAWFGVLVSSLLGMLLLLILGSTWFELLLVSFLIIFLWSTKGIYRYTDKCEEVSIAGRKRWVFLFILIVLGLSTLYVVQ